MVREPDVERAEGERQSGERRGPLERAVARRLRPAERQAGARGAPGASHQAGSDRACGDLVHAVPRDETRSLRERHDARPGGGGEQGAPAGRGPERLARDGEARRIERELPQQLERRGAREAPAVAEGEGEEAVGRGGGGERGEYDVGTGARERGEHPRERRRARERPALERGQAERAEAALAARHAHLVGGDLEPEEPRHDAPPSGSVTAVVSSRAPPAPSSTPTASSTARGSAGAVHAAFHSPPSKQRSRKARTPASAAAPFGSGASAGAKRPPSRRTSTPGPDAAASTR